MLTLNDNNVVLVTLNSSAMKLTAGANILDASGEIIVKALIKASKLHFLPGAKFCGLAGSSWPSQPTIPLSRSISGNPALVGTSGECTSFSLGDSMVKIAKTKCFCWQRDLNLGQDLRRAKEDKGNKDI